MDLPALIHECAPNVGPNTVAAIMHVESSFRPTAIGYKIVGPGRAVLTLQRQPKDTAEAVSWAQWLLANGYKFDAGIVQINSTNFDKLGLTAENVFEPCTNIRAGAYLLTEAYGRASKQYGPGTKALYAALSAYNSGNFTTGFKNGYVAEVAAKAGAPIPAAIMPPLGGQSVVARAPGAPAVKVAFADSVAYEAPPIPPNPYTADSGVQSFKRSWANPSAWAPEALAPTASGAKAPQNP